MHAIPMPVVRYEQVLNAEGYGPALDNSIAIAFTLVLVLPELRPAGRGDTEEGVLAYLLSNNLAVVILFCGLLLTSLRFPRFFHDDALLYVNETYVPFFNSRWEWAEAFGVGGLLLIWMSMLIPLGNYFRYSAFKRRIRATSMVHKTGIADEKTGARKPWDPNDGTPTRKAFCKDETYVKWDVASYKKSDQKDTHFDLMSTSQMPNMVPVNDQCFIDHNTAGPGHMWTLFNRDELEKAKKKGKDKLPKKYVLVAGPTHLEKEAAVLYVRDFSAALQDGGNARQGPTQQQQSGDDASSTTIKPQISISVEFELQEETDVDQKGIPVKLSPISSYDPAADNHDQTIVAHFEMLKRMHDIMPGDLEAYKEKEEFLDTLLLNCGISKPGDRLRVISVVKGLYKLPNIPDLAKHIQELRRPSMGQKNV